MVSDEKRENTPWSRTLKALATAEAEVKRLTDGIRELAHDLKREAGDALDGTSDGTRRARELLDIRDALVALQEKPSLDGVPEYPISEGPPPPVVARRVEIEDVPE